VGVTSRFIALSGLTLAASGELALSQLDAMDVFILDSGISLFIWVGRGASRDERSKVAPFTLPSQIFGSDRMIHIA